MKNFRHKLGIAASSLVMILFVTAFDSCEVTDNTTPEATATSDPGIEYSVGCGYNVFGQYADASALKDRVLDYSKMHADGVATVYTAETSDSSTITGDSKYDYSNNLAVSLGISGGYGAFSASVDSNFETTSSSSISHAYTTIQAHVRKIGVKVNSSKLANPSSLRDYLTDSAKAAIDGTDVAFADPQVLFAAYGTHVLTWAYYGGRMDYNTCTDTSEYSGSTSVSVIAKAAYDNGVGNASVDLSTQYGEDYNNYSSNTKTTLHFVGGDSAAGLSLNDLGTGFENWKAQFDNPDYQVLCDFETGAGTIALLPLWELCDTSTEAGLARQTALQTAFKTWASGQNDYASKGSLTLKFYQIANLSGGDASGGPDFRWEYQYNLYGLNKTGTILHNPSTDVEVGKKQYINFTPNKSWTVNASDTGTYYSITLELNSLSSLKYLYLPVYLGDNDGGGSWDTFSNIQKAIYKFSYDSTNDTFTASPDVITEDSKHAYFLSTTGDITKSVNPYTGLDWTLTRGGGEKTVQLAIKWNSTEYLWTKVGLIWN